MRFFDRIKNRAGLIIILLLYLSLAVLHSFVVPLTTGNDEWAHFLYARFIADYGRLPTTPAEREEAGYKSDAPPLYPWLVGVVAAGVEPTRLLRPLDTPRRYLADNIVDSYALVHTGVESFPYRGEVLLWHLGRLMSVLFGLSLIGLTYLTCRYLFPQQPAWALLSAALVAFTPAVLFHSSVLTYESLSAALTALFLLIALKALQQPERPLWWIALGTVAGLALITKYSAVLLPLEILFIAWLAVRERRSRGAEEQGGNLLITQYAIRNTYYVLRIAFYALWAAFPLLLISSWWFGFIIWHFNRVESQGMVAGILQPLLVGDASDTTSVNVAGFLFGQTQETRPPLARDYPQLLRAWLESFWAAPVAGQFVLSPGLPLLFTLLALVGLAGLGRAWRGGSGFQRTGLYLLLFHTTLILPLLLVRVGFSFDPREVAQGRHILLPAASAIAILLVWGWAQWSARLAGLVVLGLFLWSFLGQLGWAALVYPPPIAVWPAGASTPALAQSQPQAWTPTGSMRLKAAAWQAQGSALEVTLWWEALALATEDYLVELTLADDMGQVVGYSLGHPVQGRYPTRAWEPGDMVRDTHRLLLTQRGPGNYHLSLRLLDRAAQPVVQAEAHSLGELSLAGAAPARELCAVWPEQAAGDLAQPLRPNASLIVVGEGTPVLQMNREPEITIEQRPVHSQGQFHAFIVGPDWPASAQLWLGSRACGSLRFDIPPRHFTVPLIAQPLPANFNDEIALLGYELPTRRTEPGGRLPLTLYWRALAYMGEDYRLFANPLDIQQQRWGGYDRQPRDGYSTLRWTPGEVVTDPFGIPIDPAAPEGIYTIDLGFYRETASGLESLPLVQEGQPLEQRSLRLGPIKVGGPPPGVTTDQPEPQIELNRSLGSQITLLGYTLTVEAGQLNLRLFWRADASPQADYSVFFHLRDGANQNVSQKDGPPAGGRYPTGLWEPGEIIVDDISLSLAELPPGRYQPVVGLYNLATGERLATPDNPANEIALEPVDLP